MSLELILNNLKLKEKINFDFDDIRTAYEYFKEIGESSLCKVEIPKRGTSEFYKLFYSTLVASYVADFVVESNKANILTPSGQTGLFLIRHLLHGFAIPDNENAENLFGLDNGDISYPIHKVYCLLRDFISYIEPQFKKQIQIQTLI